MGSVIDGEPKPFIFRDHAEAEEETAVEAYYQVLATEIVSHCPADFREATLSARMDEDASEFSLSCVAGNGEVVKPRIGGLSAAKVDGALADLQQHWPGGRFSTCVFTLRPDGGFKFHVG